MKVSAQYAQEHLTDLLDTATRGDEIEITRPDQSSFRLTLVKPAAQKAKGKRILGAGRGELRVPTVKEWQAMDKELEHAMLDKPFVSAPDRSGLYGALKGQIWYADDWDSPEVNEAIAKTFNESKLFPDDPAR